jgi:LPPG:FO 2-phospho-L-lactate transferase
MKVTLLAGGTGGTKLAHGFAQLSDVDLTVVANVADDVEMHGLHVSPDIDSLLYTLGGLIDAERGWGVRADTYTAQAMFERYGQPTWFTLGDADLATHAVRTSLLRSGLSMTAATADMARSLGVGATILPATDDRLRTILETDAGILDFQDWFVRLRQEPEVRSVAFDGIEAAHPSPAMLDAIGAADLVVIGPSNPFVSIGPILALRGAREAVAGAAVSVGVSPIVAGAALKGPAERMLRSLAHEPSALGVARIYAGLLDRWVIDEADASLRPAVEALGVVVDVLPTVMRDEGDRARLASEILRLALD